jgi:ribosome-associated protein
MAKVKKKVIKKAAPKIKKTLNKKIVAKSKPAKKAVAAKATKKVAAKVSSKPAQRRLSGLPEQMRDAALKVLDERQAEEIVTFDLAGRSSVADYLIVASGRASRQLAAIAHYLSDEFSKLGVERTRVEGLPEANWVLVDGGDVIVHLFLPEVRGFYNLEGIWSKRK